jgi:hypothetical protein
MLIAACFMQRKQTSKWKWVAVIHYVLQMKKPRVFLGDTALDIVELQEQS